MIQKLPIDLKNRLVLRAEEIAQKVEDQRHQAAQLRNLLQISQTETEVPVLSNFIRYQAARNATKKFWKDIHSPVIEVLEEIGSAPATREPEMRALAIQHFFGYLIRAYVYVTSPASDEAEDGEETNDAET